MQVYTLPDGLIVQPVDQFQIGDQKYPPGWLLSASTADISAAGITMSAVADPPPQPVTLVSSLEFRQLFTEAERVAITKAAQSIPAIRVFMDDESAAGIVHLADPEVVAGVAAVVAGGLITQDRGNQILAGIPAGSISPGSTSG
jgi:hypothetical protein